MRILESALAGFQLLFCYAATGLAQEKGEVRGTVVDEQGFPLSHAKVNASNLNHAMKSSIIRYVETDEEGHFLVDRLDWGKYAVFAMKEESGYPNLGASFYSNDIFPTVIIGPQNRVASLPKARLKGLRSNTKNTGCARHALDEFLCPEPR